MPIQFINTGSAANAGDGDSLRTAFAKVNANFASLNSSSVTTSTLFYDIIPIAENVYNIGNTASSWARIYIDNSIVIKDNVISFNTATGNLTVNGIVLTNTSAGATPPSAFTTGSTWFDTISGSLFVYYSGSWVQVVGAGGAGGNAVDLLSVNSNVLPRTSNTFTLGSSTKLWNSVYTSKVYLGTATLEVNASNTLTLNGSTIVGLPGPVGPQGPTGPGADQVLDTTSSVTFDSINVISTSRFSAEAFFQDEVKISDNLIDLHYPPLSVGPIWTSSDGLSIGFNFNYWDSTATSAGLIFDLSSKRLQWFSDSLFSPTTGTYTGTWGSIESDAVYLKDSIYFADGTSQSSAFGGLANTATNALFAVTATNVDGGFVNGSVVNGTTSTTQVGYLVIPQIRIDSTPSYTLSLNDQGKHIYSVTATSQTILIPDNSSVSFPIGTAVTLVLNGAGTVSINTSSGVTMILAGTEETGNRTLLATGLATLLKVDTDTWFISGTGIN